MLKGSCPNLHPVETGRELNVKMFRSSHLEVFLRKGVLKICSKFTEEHPCQIVVSIKLQSNFVEITLRHEYSSVNLPHIFRTPFPKNTSGWLLLDVQKTSLCTFNLRPVSTWPRSSPRN